MKVFSVLITSLGTLIKIDKATENMERLDMARVLIRTSKIDFINKTVKININKENYIIRITEELCECAFEEILEYDENSTDEGEGSIASDDTCIPASMEDGEDEETMKKIKQNYEQLMNEAEHEITQNENGEYQEEALENRRDGTKKSIINKGGDKLGEGGENVDYEADKVENIHNERKENLQVATSKR
jgi:hypothetical protein